MSGGGEAMCGPATKAAPVIASPSGARRWWSLVALCLSAAIVWFAAANIPVATTAISEDLGGSVAVGMAPPDQSGAASGAFKMCSMVGGALGVALLGGIYRGLQLAQLRSDVDAAHLTAEQQELVNEAFASTERARDIFEHLAPDLQEKVHAAILAALSYGIGGSLKFAAVFSVLAFAAVLLLVPKGILHRDLQG